MDRRTATSRQRQLPSIETILSRRGEQQPFIFPGPEPRRLIQDSNPTYQIQNGPSDRLTPNIQISHMKTLRQLPVVTQNGPRAVYSDDIIEYDASYPDGEIVDLPQSTKMPSQDPHYVLGIGESRESSRQHRRLPIITENGVLKLRDPKTQSETPMNHLKTEQPLVIHHNDSQSDDITANSDDLQHSENGFDSSNFATHVMQYIAGKTGIRRNELFSVDEEPSTLGDDMESKSSKRTDRSQDFSDVKQDEEDEHEHEECDTKPGDSKIDATTRVIGDTSNAFSSLVEDTEENFVSLPYNDHQFEDDLEHGSESPAGRMSIPNEENAEHISEEDAVVPAIDTLRALDSVNDQEEEQEEVLLNNDLAEQEDCLENKASVEPIVISQASVDKASFEQDDYDEQYRDINNFEDLDRRATNHVHAIDGHSKSMLNDIHQQRTIFEYYDERNSSDGHMSKDFNTLPDESNADFNSHDFVTKDDQLKEVQLQDDRLQEDRFQEDEYREDHLEGGQLQGDQFREDQLQGDHFREDQFQEDQFQEDQFLEDQYREDQFQQDDLQLDHSQQDQLQQDLPRQHQPEEINPVAVDIPTFMEESASVDNRELNEDIPVDTQNIGEPLPTARIRWMTAVSKIVNRTGAVSMKDFIDFFYCFVFSFCTTSLSFVVELLSLIVLWKRGWDEPPYQCPFLSQRSPVEVPNR